MINRIVVKTYNTLVVFNLMAVINDIVLALGKHMQ